MTTYYEFDDSHLTKTCAICGIRKPFSSFLLDVIHLSSMCHIKKYSDICDECRIEKLAAIPFSSKSEKKKSDMVHNINKKKKNLDDDIDDSGGGGKGKRLTSDLYAKLSSIFKKDISARIASNSVHEIDTKHTKSTTPGMSSRR